MHHPCLQLRVLCQANLNILCCFVENFASCHRVADSFVWIRNLKDTCHELSDAVGAVTFACSSSQLHTLNHSEGHKDCCQRGCGGDGDSVRPNVLLHAIGKARWPCLYRFMVKIAVYVRREFRRRGVTPCAVPLQGLHRDPVKIALKQANEFLWLRSARLCYRFRRVALRAGLGAWARRIFSRNCRSATSSGCFRHLSLSN